jgi:hypothetical protein
MARAIIVGVGIVNPSACGLAKQQGVGMGASAVCVHHDETDGSKQSKEQMYVCLIDARGIRLTEAEARKVQRGAKWGRIKCVLLLVSVDLSLFRQAKYPK